MKIYFAMLAASAICVLSAQSRADVVFDSSFTSAEGFSDGNVLFGGSNPDSVIGQGNFSITDSAGSGFLSSTGTGFSRALFGWDPGNGFNEGLINGLGVGSTIEIEAMGLTFSPEAGTAGNRNVGVFGLSNIDGSNILGASSVAAGGQFVFDDANDVLHIDRNTAFTANLDLNTGIASGESFDYRQVWTVTSGGTFDIEHFVNGASIGVGTGITPIFDKSSTEVTGFIQDFGQAGGPYSVDAMRLSFTAVPEPSSMALLGIGLVGFAIRRKRAA